MKALRLLVAAAALSLVAHAHADDPTLLLEHANVFMGAKALAQHDVTVIVDGNRVKDVVPTAQAIPGSAQTRRLNLHGAWILPGLIDAHVHIYDIPSAQHMLSLGITAGRSMLTTAYEDVGLRTLDRRGDKDLPHILAAGFPVVAHPMTFVPGLSSLFFINPDLDDLRLRERIGADGAARIVADNAKRRVDWIKVFVNGRAGVLKADPRARDLDDAELTSAVNKATELGIPVAVHGFTDEAVSAAVRAGVKTVEHGSLITEPTLKLMFEHGTCFTPTVSVVLAHAKDPPVSASAEEKALAARLKIFAQSARKAVETAHKLGVPIIAGTDSMYDAPDATTVIDEIQNLSDMGLGPAAAIDAATSVAAACLRIADHSGAILPGLDADLVAYAKEPSADLRTLRNPLLIVKQGDVYLDKLNDSRNETTR